MGARAKGDDELAKERYRIVTVWTRDFLIVEWWKWGPVEGRPLKRACVNRFEMKELFSFVMHTYNSHDAHTRRGARPI